ncbi:MAG: D-alanyl-D-alanine carboxypeptidase family protein [Solirubrobacteraceae bacterium]
MPPAASRNISSAYRKTHTCRQHHAAFNGGVTYGKPARTAARRSRSTVYGRRGRALLAAVLVLFLAHAALAGSSRSRPATARPGLNDTDRADLSSVRWPLRGQAALVLGNGRPAASPHEQPAPIASLAKVMTAYLTLKRYPLNGARDGFTITVTEAQAQAQAEARDQSVVAVQAGEQLTERQLLEALLIPSGNNIARMLAARVAGSETRFLAEMNAEARALRMDHTAYTDPSGFNPSTVSTAADQLRVFQRAMRFSVFRQIVSMATVTLPVAGTVTNYNPLTAQGYAGKTGSDSAAKGCLAFFTHVTGGGRGLTVAGVVMGQGEGSDTSALLAAAGEAAVQVVDSVAPETRAPRTGRRPRPRNGGLQQRTSGEPKNPELPADGFDNLVRTRERRWSELV